MFDDFTLIPEGAFEAMGSVANNLIDKLSSAVGYVFIPKGKIKDKEEAVKYYIEEIKNNSTMPDLAKAAMISNARKLIKEYSNQYDIIDIAMGNISKDAKPEELDDNWISFFMENAKHIETDDVKLMFGKILAEECEKPGCVSKSLIHKLTIMTSNQASAFAKINKCCFAVKGAEDEDEKVKIPFISEISDNEMLTYEEAVELETIGLVEKDCIQNYIFRFSKFVDTITLKYGKHEWITQWIEELPVGLVIFTKDGKILSNCLCEEHIEGYEQCIKKYYDDNGIQLEEK